ncbi:MAG: arginine--tRNA ligase, partial [bacterium]
FFLNKSCARSVIKEIVAKGTQFAHLEENSGPRITLEYVSANPTGPLHVGHGRGAAYGSTLANLFKARGFDVQREYYVNDFGRQMDILACSVWLRYLELSGEKIIFPVNAYKGDYIYNIARSVREIHGDDVRQSWPAVSEGLPADETEGGDKEAYIDAIIERAKSLLGDEMYRAVFDQATRAILGDIKQDLQEFGVEYDSWFSERSLGDSGAIQHALDRLKENGHLYEDGATWFRATTFGDEKDRVVVRDNGMTTYFASDIAYMLNKFERGFEKAIYILGADHHGYIPRLKAAAQGLGVDPERLDIKLVQFAILFENGQKISMSTRSGQFVTLRQLREDVGTDAARFFYVMRSHEQHLDFDLDLARSQSNDNPVYYVQYAHARICSVFRKLEESGLSFNQELGESRGDLLTAESEQKVIKLLSRYEETLKRSVDRYAPHILANYLRDLAKSIHSWYNAEQFILDDIDLMNARLNLALASQYILAGGLELLGVSAPEQM